MFRNEKKPFAVVNQLPEKDDKDKTLGEISEVYSG